MEHHPNQDRSNHPNPGTTIIMNEPIPLSSARTILSRPDLAQLIHLVHEKIAKFKPHTNESDEMFEFRIRNWRDLLLKLQAVFEEQGR